MQITSGTRVKDFSHTRSVGQTGTVLNLFYNTDHGVTYANVVPDDRADLEPGDDVLVRAVGNLRPI